MGASFMHMLTIQRFRFGLCLFVAALAVTGATASAQDVVIIPRFRTGDEFRLALTRIRENVPRSPQDGKSTTLVDVRVVLATAEGAILDWVPGETTVENGQLAQDPLLLAASAAMSGVQPRIRLNANGEFIGLTNEPEVVSKVQAATDVIVQGLSAKLPPEQRAAFQAFIAQVLSPTTLIASITREAQMYFALNGAELEVGERVETVIEQPSPLGGGVLPATFRIRAESATADAATLVTTTAYDSAAFARLTQGLAAQSGNPLPPAEIAKLPPFEMIDEGRYVLDRSLGMMREIAMNRRLTVGTNRRLDRWEIRLVTPPQR